MGLGLSKKQILAIQYFSLHRKSVILHTYYKYGKTFYYSR